MIFIEREATVQKIISYFRTRGITDKGISGLLGNWFAESNFYSNNLQNGYNTRFGMSDEEFTNAVDNGTFNFLRTDVSFGYGFAQWTSIGRRTGLYNLVKSRNVSISDEDTQLDWAYEELIGPYKKVLNVLTNPISTVADCAEIVVTSYEKPASVLNESTRQATIDRRVEYAKEFYRKYFLAEAESEKNMSKTVIALSAGHWNGNPKGIKAPMPFLVGTSEFTLNNNVCQLIKKKSADYPNLEIVMVYDETGNDGNQKTNGNAARIKKAEVAKANMLLDIHHNAGGGSGTTTYHYNTDKNKDQAKRLHDHIVNHTGLKGNRANGGVSNGSGYEMVRDPSMASFIVECCFMDNASDVTYMASTNWFERVAEGILAFLVEEFHLTNNTTSTTNRAEETKTEVKEEVKKEVTTNSVEEVPFKVRIDNSIRIYTKSNFETGKGTFTITEQIGNMGKLKSGKGWICLADTKKV